MTTTRPQQTRSRRERAAALPAYEPQLATLVEAPPRGEAWVHEIKYDGYRIGCLIQGEKVSLISRNGKDWTSKFPELAEACRGLRVDSALLDGEAVIVLDDGRTSFQALQNSFSGGSRTGFNYFAFDLLFLNGVDLREEPLSTRKAQLQKLLPRRGVIKYSEDILGDGQEVLDQACKLGLEGIVSKRADRPHRARRSEEWQKTKCARRQEFVVGGFTDPSGTRAGIGALLLGYYRGRDLVYAGRVGTGKGFTAAYLSGVRADLDKVESAECPFGKRPPSRALKGVHWLDPVRVVEVSFAEWTSDGQIRHSSLVGFRDDKRAQSITREQPEPPNSIKSPKARGVNMASTNTQSTRPAKARTTSKKARTAKSAVKVAPGKAAIRKAATTGSVRERLSVYRKKRDFSKTREPAGERSKPEADEVLSFVVQKHAARRLHYDFRLELDGVLLSWSVPKGPTLKPGDRRLAVRTEDHPLDYADFEGLIPKGQYGGGAVLVWDQGTWRPLSDPREGMKKGKLTFELSGDKLKGRFHLVRTHGQAKGENWLLLKGRDGEAREGEVTDESPESVVSGKTIEEIAETSDKVWTSNRSDDTSAKPKREKRAATPAPAKASVPSQSARERLAGDVVSLVRRIPASFPLTNLEKVLYPEQGLRKAELIAYFVAIADFMLPHVAGRPLTLVRCPNGRGKHCFYQKHAKDGVPDVVKRVAITEAEDEQDYMMVRDTFGLIALGQLGALELHTWTCHADAVEKPDQWVFDLDPDEALPWEAVVEAAFDVRKELEALGFATFVKTTGGKGLHVVVPLKRGHGWDEHKALARIFVERMSEFHPKRFVTNARKDLRKGRIFLDYLRNGRGATAIAPYSMRAREGATVATPLSWEELERGVSPKSFNVKTLIGRMNALKADPWHDYDAARVPVKVKPLQAELKSKRRVS